MLVVGEVGGSQTDGARPDATELLRENARTFRWDEREPRASLSEREHPRGRGGKVIGRDPRMDLSAFEVDLWFGRAVHPPMAARRTFGAADRPAAHRHGRDEPRGNALEVSFSRARCRGYRDPTKRVSLGRRERLAQTLGDQERKMNEEVRPAEVALRGPARDERDVGALADRGAAMRAEAAREEFRQGGVHVEKATGRK